MSLFIFKWLASRFGIKLAHNVSTDCAGRPTLPFVSPTVQAHGYNWPQRVVGLVILERGLWKEKGLALGQLSSWEKYDIWFIGI